MIVAGLMSGTSVDGIDVALVEIRGRRIQPLAHFSFPYRRDLRRAVLGISNTSTHTAEIARLNFLLGERFAAAVLRACRLAKVGRVDLIGSHGQTIYHQGTPQKLLGRPVSCTLQIGEPAVIAARTGVDVVADFRPADMAAGGQGAPLVPYVDYLLYRHSRLSRVALNIGGIANVTVIPGGAKAQDVVAFDTGPGNMILDALAQRFLRQAYDRDGKMAARGKVSRKLLDKMLSDPYFRRRPPKSAGREQYGSEFIAGLLRERLAPQDLMATMAAFTAASVAVGIRRFSAGPDELIISGGGLRNAYLMAQIAAFLPEVRIRTSNEFGIDSDAKEAIAFAVLAYESYHRRPSNLPSATGARRPVILGKIVYAGAVKSRTGRGGGRSASPP